MTPFRDLARAGLWLGLYVLLALYPLLWLAAVPAPYGGDFRQELASALGFLALSSMAMQFVLTARFHWLAPPFGTDMVYAFHRHLTAVAVALALAHPLVLFRGDLGVLGGFLLPWRWPWGVAAGAISLYALALLAATSYGRRRLRLPYEPWRKLHGLAAAAAVVLGLWHAVDAGRLLAGPVTRTMWIIWTLGWVALLLRVRVAKPAALLGRPYTVVEVRREPGDAVTLVLDPDGHQGFRFRAGQFAWVTLGGSPFAAAEHPFSFSGSSQRAPRVEFTVKALGDFTRRAQETRPGARAYVDGPFGSMSLDAFPDADGFVFVAGGVGIAPCISMLRTLADRGDRRSHVLVYGTSALDRTAFREDLAGLSKQLSLSVIHVLERPPEGWTGERGLVSEGIIARHLPREGRHECFVCGPPAMMDVAERALARLGVPVGNIHSERFDLV